MPRTGELVAAAALVASWGSHPASAADLAYSVTDLGTLRGSDSFGVAIAPSPRTINVIDVPLSASVLDGDLGGGGEYSVVACQQPFELTQEELSQFLSNGAGNVIAFEFEFGGSRWQLDSVARLPNYEPPEADSGTGFLSIALADSGTRNGVIGLLLSCTETVRP